MKTSVTFSATEVKRAAAEQREEFSLGKRRTVRVEVKGKAIPTNFLKIKGKGTFVGIEDRKKKGDS